MGEWTAIIGVLAALSGALLGWMGYARTHKNQTQAEATSDALLRSDVEYIKRGVDDIRIDAKEQKKEHKREIGALSERVTRVEESTKREIGALSERITRVEESTKQAHKRIDGLDT